MPQKLHTFGGNFPDAKLLQHVHKWEAPYFGCVCGQFMPRCLGKYFLHYRATFVNLITRFFCLLSATTAMLLRNYPFYMAIKW